MHKTLILLFHPDLSRSNANAALGKEAANLDNVEVVDIQALYPEGIDIYRDGEREAARLLSADRIVLQFPIHWYSMPAIMRQWQDAVLTRMFYLNYEEEGQKLEGTPLFVAVTAGNVEESYRPDGRNLFTIESLLAPLRATAHRCGLIWRSPFVVYTADKLEPVGLKAKAEEYVMALHLWREEKI
ncbi:NAD(P)H-dependent oxidoreductase [Cedecea sp. P7760]|jgi:glutathione-regulated potassium-efflux system ancillary protein KefG|uniref:NAD(P)H-dependent oxidoreductase n=1 Tax=Cedecea TaxID=158483 RepID=UPI0015A2C0C4|nr:NAD(P)H-dependent oxidoreductase [Cedecea sp. P7760]NWC65467.1 NAD(P)H-dependent oxidoreductase [Cedecea sp. P7760]